MKYKALLLALLASTFVASPAFAQKGKRMCGIVAQTSAAGDMIGILVEVNKKIPDHDCNNIKDEIKKKALAKDPRLNSLTWKDVKKESCESVGYYFLSANNNQQDMCDLMKDNTPYQFVKKDNSTTYGAVQL